MTRREKHAAVLDLVEEYLASEDGRVEVAGFVLTGPDLLHAVRWSRGREDDAPPWWPEVNFELRAERRELREERESQ